LGNGLAALALIARHGVDLRPRLGRLP
jgi:hypothetical protein